MPFPAFPLTISWSSLRRFAVAATTMLIGMAVLWALLWIIAAAQYRNLVDNWIAAEKARGGEITYDDRSSGGFPRGIILTFSNLRWHNAAGEKADIGSLILSAHPWNWHAFDMKMKQDITITLPFPNETDPILIKNINGHGHIVLDNGDHWNTARLVLRDVHASRLSHELFAAEELVLGASLPNQSPKDHTETGATAYGHATNMVVTSDKVIPFGDKVPSVDLALRVMGPLPDVYNKASVAAWNNDSGVVECDNLTMEWGPLSLAAKGTLALDDDLQPEGAFAGTIGGYELAIKALLDNNWIPQRQAGMLNSALGLFSKPSKLAIGKPSLEMPITVQLGGLFLGPVRIFAFPTIDWPVKAESRL